MNAAVTGVAADSGDAILAVNNVHKHFDGVAAVDGCSFDIRPGTVTGLIGPNGAGKSTMFDLMTGVTRPDRGDIAFDGTAIGGRAPEHVVTQGMGRTFQTPRLFHQLTAWENLMVAGQKPADEGLLAAFKPRRRAHDSEQRTSDQVHEVLTFLGLQWLADESAANLSGGQRKLLSLGRVLMLQPRLILLDEPAAGVNETLARQLFEHIRTLNARGVTFVVIEHDMNLVMRLCDELVVMHQGKTLAQGAPMAIQQNQAVLDAYLGGQV